MLKWMKFILKLELSQKIILKALVEQILSGNWEGLDIKKVAGKSGYYRCRKGKIRIIFYKEGQEYYISDIDFRGGVYKGL